MTRIVFIGAGNVATHMAIAAKNAGHEVSQVWSRTAENAAALARKVNAEPVFFIPDLCADADLYLFSVKDDVLPGLAEQMPETTGAWAHTAGSVPFSVLTSYHRNCGVVYPLQTFTRERDINFRAVPLFVEANDRATETMLLDFAKTLSGNVALLDGEKRRLSHLAAVFACNFTNHMYTLAAEIAEQAGIPFSALWPLIGETADKARAMAPLRAQTGPAVRNDREVMQKHLTMLPDPLKRKIYVLLSESIHSSSLLD